VYRKTEGLERLGPPSEPARPRTEERIEIADLVDVQARIQAHERLELGRVVDLDQPSRLMSSVRLVMLSPQGWV
jgi:hypothetical protein